MTELNHVRCEECELDAARMSYAAGLGASEWEAFIHHVPRCSGCRQVSVLLGVSHGQLPAPTVEQLLEPDPDIYLAGGPLAPDHCDCAGVCECGEAE